MTNTSASSASSCVTLKLVLSSVVLEASGNCAGQRRGAGKNVADSIPAHVLKQIRKEIEDG